MTKDDYEKLLNSFQETDKYAIQSHENDKYFFRHLLSLEIKKVDSMKTNQLNSIINIMAYL